MRAIITLLNDGSTYDITPPGVALASALVSEGVFRITGSQGLVPFPPVSVGWGYSLSQMDSKADVAIEYDESGELLVSVTRDDRPYRLVSTLMLHVLVADLPDMPVIQSMEG
ncbi:hypothetical protein LOY42_20195 [Pseudomonas sp. B21-023]|uniref:hypothetical protein n=1 Tax=unclassified Pseudomonas TaxID=196821 RepID=UPI001119ECC4|nr:MULTISPECIES: hypothetical protein [unclassified Pseudomonas]UVL18207.1 hypothetical protein LOY44_19745 [Pseudomonas sp. B21-044]UVM15571.1 hypothetical protein LOY42_20195 [Pseudomonas sp. B21-023]